LLGATLVCAVAYSTNVSPAALVAALDSHGPWSPEAWFVLNGAVGAYNLAFNGLQNTNITVAAPYLKAVCNGLDGALMMPAPSPAARVTRQPVVVNPRWPQMK
jgi:hypothetical protein